MISANSVTNTPSHIAVCKFNKTTFTPNTYQPVFQQVIDAMNNDLYKAAHGIFLQKFTLHHERVTLKSALKLLFRYEKVFKYLF